MRNGEIMLLFTDVGKSCSIRLFLTLQTCLLTLFVKISEFTLFKTSSMGVSLAFIGLGLQGKVCER